MFLMCSLAEFFVYFFIIISTARGLQLKLNFESSLFRPDPFPINSHETVAASACESKANVNQRYICYHKKSICHVAFQKLLPMQTCILINNFANNSNFISSSFSFVFVCVVFFF